MTDRPDATGRRPDRAAFIVAVMLAGLGALLVWEGFRIPDKGGYSGVGPGDVPKLVGYGLLGLALWTGIAGLREGAEPRTPQALPPVLWIVGGLLLQLVLLKPLGFGIASGLLFACTAAAFGKRNLLLTVPVGVAFALVVYGVFDRLLQLNLPAGFLESTIFDGLGQLLQPIPPPAG